jgi:hypothetical protein
MSDPADQARIDQRAQLLPEAQAAAILADSDDRTERPAETMRESPQTPND